MAKRELPKTRTGKVIAKFETRPLDWTRDDHIDALDFYRDAHEALKKRILSAGRMRTRTAEEESKRVEKVGRLIADEESLQAVRSKHALWLEKAPREMTDYEKMKWWDQNYRR